MVEPSADSSEGLEEDGKVRETLIHTKGEDGLSSGREAYLIIDHSREEGAEVLHWLRNRKHHRFHRKLNKRLHPEGRNDSPAADEHR